MKLTNLILIFMLTIAESMSGSVILTNFKTIIVHKTAIIELIL